MTLLPAFPLGTAYLPGEAVILRVFEDRYVRLLRDTESGDRTFVSVLIQAGSEVGGGEKRFDTGVSVVIDHVQPSDIGFQVYAHALHVVDVLEWNDDAEYARARVEIREDEAVGTGADRAALAAMVSAIEGLVDRTMSLGLSEGNLDHITTFLRSGLAEVPAGEMWPTFWHCASLIPCTPLDRYELLRERGFVSRATRATGVIEHIQDLLTFRYG